MNHSEKSTDIIGDNNPDFANEIILYQPDSTLSLDVR